MKICAIDLNCRNAARFTAILNGCPLRRTLRSRRFPTTAQARQRRKLSARPFAQRAMAVTILRPSNAYGPGQSMRGGFGLIRTLLEHARAGTAMEIWGDGENVRDFIYIEDVVEACMRLIALPQDSGTYNLGSGRGYSINQVRRIVERVTGIELKVSHCPARGIDVGAVVLDISRIEARLSWKPQISLEAGVRRTLEWLRRA